MILTLDLGTSGVKAGLWEHQGLVDLAESPLQTFRPEPGASEQDPAEWWAAVVSACGQLAARDPARLAAVEAVGCTGARQTFALFDATGTPVGPAVLWSDTRADRSVATPAGQASDRATETHDGGPDGAAGSHGGASEGGPTEGGASDGGASVGGASVASRLAWVAGHRADQLERSAWILGPRDRVVWHLTGTVATDATMASLTGCYAPDGQIVDHLAGMVGDRLPPVVPSDRVTGPLVAGAAEQLGLASGVPVVIGAGDRQCEVLGTGATGVVPMVSWGTTANVSLPVAVRPSPAPAGVVVSRAAADGWQLEGGVSAAGSLLGWLAGLCGRTPAELADLAAASPPGARGITAVPWLGGARAPWWRPGAGAAFVGLSGDHGPGDLARALYEAVASDIRRCLGRMAGDHGPGPEISALELTGGGASLPVWTEVLTGATGLPGRLRRSGQAASAGAALLAARAIGRSWDLEALDPVVRRFEVDPEIGRRYGELADHADRVAGALVDLGPPPPCG